MSSAKVPPKPSKDTIYVDVDDEITSIIDKVENSEHKVVALVLPKRAASLQSIVNMKLLKRSADTAGKSVVLITSESALMPLAGAAGLHVARNLQSAPEIPEAPVGAVPSAKAPQETPETETELESPEENDGDKGEDLPKKIDYDRPIGALAARHEAENPETIDLDEDEVDKLPEKTADKPKQTKGEKIKVPNFDRFRMLLGLGGLALVALIVFIILALFVLPKATITIKTTSEPVSASFNLNASSKFTKLDPKAGNIPAKLEKINQTGSQDVTATGQENKGDKATGSVTMTSCVSSPTQVSDIPAGTGISTNGLTYITQQNASFNWNGDSCNGGSNFKLESNSVNITAQQGGTKFNTSINGATVAGYSSVTADGSADGGTDNMVTVLSQSDVDSAKQKLTSGSNDTTAFTKSFEDKLTSQGEYVLTTTLKSGNPVVTSSPSVGQPASTAKVTVKITYSVLAIHKSDLSKAIEHQLSKQIDSKKQKLNGNFINDATVNVQDQPSSSSATLFVNEDTTAVPIINVQQVKQLAEGSKVGDIKSAINDWPGVKDVDVKLSPFWVSKAPKKDSKVTVVLQEIKSGSASSNGNSGAP